MKLSLVLLEALFVLVLSQQGCSKTTSEGGFQSGILRQKNYPLLWRIVREGGHRGMAECQQQFQNEIWNCSLANKNVFKQLPIFVKTTLPHATRETAFLHAISAAAITHELTLQCRQNRIPGCKCGKTRRQPKGNIGWQWGGCSDDIKFGEKETRRFIDKLERGGDAARTAFNLHNNEVGRKVVRASLTKECKCHGVTGSCNLKTCWKQLAPFNVVGSELKQKYRAAVRVSFLNNKLHKRDNNRDRRDRLVTRKDKKLVYLDSSPDYCVRNATAGSPGMRGRTCLGDQVSTGECRSLCNSCNLRHRTVEQSKQVKCRCKFVWCCTVKCKLCNVKYSRTTCV
ncbi:Protein Wnt-8b [Desmophyllum pertusum]|uniref:Protein Wnt n=1 Tax=Desmophyllum pertusum TaxID=174260 RepID=A0A9X0DAP8_9CNID|nr:Protein Wnt-8b [Desmophyllum pertusum]